MSQKVQKISASSINQMTAMHSIPSVSDIVIELVHNALDANARAIQVQLELNEALGVSVIDDGDGITFNDLSLVFDMNCMFHGGYRSSLAATNKSSGSWFYGKNGRALASIASLANVIITSRKAISIQAYYVQSIDGVVKVGISESDHPVGTTVKVWNIFHSLPVRRQAALTDSNAKKQWSMICHGLTSLALAQKFDRGFSCVVRCLDSKSTLFEIPKTKDITTLLRLIIPECQNDQLRYYECRFAGIIVRGYMSVGRSITAKHQYISLARVPLAKYNIHDIITKDSMTNHPIYVCELICPADDYDLTVVPFNSTVQFKNSDDIESAVKIWARRLSRKYVDVDTVSLTSTTNASTMRIKRPASSESIAKNAKMIEPTPVEVSDLVSFSKQKSWFQSTFEGWRNPVWRGAAIGIQKDACPFAFMSSMSKQMLQELNAIAQLENKFIVCSHKDDDGLTIVLVDQHAADERIRLENIWKENLSVPSTSSSVPSIEVEEELKVTLLSPLTLKDVLKRYHDRLSFWGFSYTFTTFTELQLKTVPATLFQRHKDIDFVQHVFTTMIQEWEMQDHASSALSSLFYSRQNYTQASVLAQCPKVLIESMNSHACRYAIMFGDSLERQECVDLIKKLSRCDFPFQCAHGRPSIVPLTHMKH